MGVDWKEVNVTLNKIKSIYQISYNKVKRQIQNELP